MNKIIKFLASAAIAAVLLAGCMSNESSSQQDSSFGANEAQVQQTSQQSSGFADKQYIWQDWTTDSSQFKGQVK